MVEVAGYAWLGHPDARGALLAVTFGAVVVTAGVWFIGPAMARHRHHAAFFVVWSSGVVACILAGAALDGGEKSPIAVLLFLPMLYAALGYRPLIVLLLGAPEVVGYMTITYTDATPNTAYAALMAATLTLTVLMAALSARTREAQARELHALTARLEAEATRDSLTDCLNRRGFDAAIEAEVSRAIRYGRPMSLLLLDVDHLKKINDTHGHSGGDAALQQVASAIHRARRPNDVAARFGGDEFALLIPESGIAGALQLAERIHAALHATTGRVSVTVSIGAASINSEITTVDELLRAADSALYRAKRTGRGQSASFDDLPGRQA
ncbi:MAG TPA: GGDEF domain-containing protein, partial [Ilumatobacteraceae bacterium]|nr:GGDEF domain-containing protein [Ilumatobacteraceae bacterium]